METSTLAPRALTPARTIRRLQAAGFALLLASSAFGQAKPESNDVTVNLKAIAGFRGAVANQLQGFGLITGLAASGDTKKVLQTQKAIINLLRQNGMEVDPSQSETKNVALVALSAELPAYARPGARLDVTASSIGDSTSLRGGHLMFAVLRYPGNDEVVATAQGEISVGGASATAGGSSTTKGFTTVGTVPSGAIVQRGIDTNTVSKDGKLYLDLTEADPVVTQRVETAINRRYPEFHALAAGAGSVQLDLPIGMSENTAQARLLELSVSMPAEARIVIDERTGTIVIGGDVRVGPCVVAHGGLTIKVTDTPFVSQPAPLSGGKTVAGSVKTVDVKETTAEIAAIRANTSIGDLAAMFHALRLKASDVFDILMTMRKEGALKARVEVR